MNLNYYRLLVLNSVLYINYIALAIDPFLGGQDIYMCIYVLETIASQPNVYDSIGKMQEPNDNK